MKLDPNPGLRAKYEFTSPASGVVAGAARSTATTSPASASPRAAKQAGRGLLAERSAAQSLVLRRLFPRDDPSPGGVPVDQARAPTALHQHSNHDSGAGLQPKNEPAPVSTTPNRARTLHPHVGEFR